jgi:hypothetical protein
MKNSLLLVSFAFIFNIQAQTYIEGGKTRHRFAQMTVGFDSKVNLGNGTSSYRLNSKNELEKFKLNDQYSSRLIIGGTHFWGHADFYIAIPVANWNTSGFDAGVETGFRYFPWQIKHNKIRPFIGTAFLSHNYQQGNGTTLSRFKYPLTAGFIYNKGNHLFEIGTGYNFQAKEEYYISTTQTVQISTNTTWLSLGYKWMIETTLSAEKDWESGRTKVVTDTLARRKKLNGFTLGVGPSSAFYTITSEHNALVAPYADNHKVTVFAEFGLGYYWHKPDLHVQLAYRQNKSELKAYDFKQTVSRKAFTLEAYKFIGDYHGFAPFIGPAISYEQLSVDQTLANSKTTGDFNGFKPGITVGWDIRPNRIQVFYLRTHLRYFPNLNVAMNTGKSVSLDQFEFNFIELVLFPGRLF